MRGIDQERFATVLERYTEGARGAVEAAREEAVRLGHGHAGTGHLLLGLLRDEEEGAAARALGALGITPAAAREQVQNFGGRGDEGALNWAPLTSRLARVLELAPREADRLGHDHVDTEHLLFRLAREANSVAVRALSALGVGPADVRRATMRFARGPQRRRPEKPARRSGLPEHSTRDVVPDDVPEEPEVSDEAPSTTFRGRIQALEVHVRCGVTDEERALPQALLVDLAYVYEARTTDDVSGTVDYGVLLEEAARVLEGEEFRLLETGARRVGEHVLEKFPEVREISVTLTKPKVPVARSLSGVSVRAMLRR